MILLRVISVMWSVSCLTSFDDGSSLVYSEYVRGDWLVVDDLSEADYSYAEGLDCYEVRRKGVRLGRFEEWCEVVSFLEEQEG